MPLRFSVVLSCAVELLLYGIETRTRAKVSDAAQQPPMKTKSNSFDRPRPIVADVIISNWRMSNVDVL